MKAAAATVVGEHLVVLSHGLMGSSHDFSYLASLLRKSGCDVLTSKANELQKSVKGAEIGGKALANEVMDMVKDQSSYKKISFVGNSLGGLYARYGKIKYFVSI